MWKDRKQAGRELAIKLISFKNKKNTLVLGIPRGGIAVAREISDILDLPLDVIITRKIGAPDEPELAIGAVDENGIGVFNETLIEYAGITDDYIQKETNRQKDEIWRRLALYRQGRPTLDLKNKIVLLIDDGIATGFTMASAIKSCVKKGAKMIVVAVPVVAYDTVARIKDKANKLVYLEAPTGFAAVGQFYEEFEQLNDEDVVNLLKPHE